MRTVGEIVEAVQEREPATEEELRLALLCLYYDGGLATRHDGETAHVLLLRMTIKDSFERRFKMMRLEPSVYLGPNWTPGTPENDKQRKMSKGILRAFEQSQSAKEKP